MLSYIQLKSYVVLCNTSSFSATALLLSTNQPTISKRISQIESFLNKKLLLRQTNGREILLTEDGKVFLQNAKSIIRSYDNLNSLIGKEEKNNKHISIGSIISFFHIELSERVKKLAELYPDMNFEIEIRGTDFLVNELRNNNKDIIFTSEDCSDPYVETKYIMHLTCGWYASEELFEKLSIIKDMREIFAKFPIIMCREEVGRIQTVRNALKNKEIGNFTIHATNYSQMMVELVEQGFGFGYFPKMYIEKDNRNRREKLVELKLFPIEGFNLYAAILRNGDKRECFDFIVDYIYNEI